MNPRLCHLPFATLVAFTFLAPRSAQSADAAVDNAAEGWIELAAEVSSADWRADHRGWASVGDAAVDPENDRRLRGVPGAGVLLGKGGSSNGNMFSKREFQDIELKFEFMVPRGSNSGVKLNGLYEIQIRDSHAAKKPTADDCGGVYPRAELKPSYRFLDDGVPPRVNAARPAGQWQTLELEFVAPRFDGAGKKIQNARFVRVVLNGQTIHENVDLRWPTGHAWDEETEVPQGPLMFQGDHGPVALRHIQVRPLPAQ
jgi:hypothetical protein